MSNPWEETWRALGGGIVCGDMTPDSWSCAFWHPSGPIDERAARARLAAAAPDLVRALLAVEFATYDGAERWCPWCSSYGVSSHDPDCLRQAALRKAGVIK